MADEKTCPHCGKPVSPTALGGICPECMLKAGLASQTEGPGAVGPQGTKVVQPPPAPTEIASLFPQLEILELVGQGGMGVVYKARQPALDRFVALKILAPRPGHDADFAERFTREARALAKLNHPNIVAVYDFGVAAGVPPAIEPGILPGGQTVDVSKIPQDPGANPGGRMSPSTSGRRPDATTLHYFIMEFVDGPNLRQVEQAGKLSPREALEIIPQICAALQYAHEQGVVHRDIKPENILLDKQGRVKIADFGIAKILGQGPKDMSLTGAKDVVGTPHYMAPEQVEKPLTVDHRADIYSLGVVFYEMLTGELPLGKFQPPSAKVQIDVRLDEVVLHALEKEPDRRYQQVSEVKTRLETIASTSAATAVSAVSAEVILARDYTLNIRDCLRQGWALVRNDFWPLVGMSAFVMVVLSTASSSGVMLSDGKSSGTTSILGILLSGPFMGGLYLYFLKKIRREAAGVETAFTGFRHPFPHLIIGGFLATLLTTLGFLCLILPGIYLFTAWIFTFPLIVDRRLDFWPAMQLSRKIISKHWWKFLGFLLVLGLVNLVGIAACCIGLFITFPVTFAALAYAYEDITGAAKSQAGAAPSIPPTAPATPPTPQPDHFWRRFAVVMTCVILISVAIAIIGLSVAIAIPNFVHAREQTQALHEQTEKRKQPAKASAETWSPTLAPGEKPDLQKILDEAKTFMEHHKYEESLQRHLWHFNHAQEFGDAWQNAVRLTSALSDWEELGRRYPKAKQALIEIRDNKTREIAEGRGYLEIFQEVQAIDRELQDDDATVALFKIIHQQNKKLSGECYGYAENLLMQKGEYELCLNCIGDPQSHFESCRHSLEMQIESQQRMTEMRKQYPMPVPRLPKGAFTPPDMGQMATNNFVGQVCKLVEILVATGHKADAEKIRDQAVAVLDDARLKSAVSDVERKIGK